MKMADQLSRRKSEARVEKREARSEKKKQKKPREGRGWSCQLGVGEQAGYIEIQEPNGMAPLPTLFFPLLLLLLLLLLLYFYTSSAIKL